MLLVFFVFFFKQKTAYEMRISDWSSDVCSSDLYARPRLTRQDIGALHLPSVSPSPSSVTPNFPSALDIQDDYFDGPAVADLGGEASAMAPVDMMDATGQSALY